MLGFDPILLDNVDLNKWLNETDDNFVLYINKKAYCLKKSYFLNTKSSEIFHICNL